MTQLTDWKGRRKQSELLLPIDLDLDKSNPRNVRIPMGLKVMLMEFLNDKRKAFRFTVPEAELGGVKHISERCNTH